MRIAGRDMDQLITATPGVGIRRRWREFRKPDEVVVHGVWVPLGPRWATLSIRNALYHGWYEQPMVETLRGTVRPDDTILEIGGGLGVVTTIACQLVGHHRVTTFEANPELIAIIRETAAANGHHPQVIHAVLGPDDRDHDFFINQDFWASSLSGSYGGEPIPVEGRSFDSELDRIRPSYLVLDVEGAEVDMLMQRDLPDWLRAVCIEVHPDITGRKAVGDLISHLSEQGFSIDLAVAGRSVAYLERVEG